MTFAAGLFIGVVVGGVVTGVAISGAFPILVHIPRSHVVAPEALIPVADGEEPAHSDPYRGRSMSELLTSPPIVDTIYGQKTLGEYLKHHPGRDGVWHGIVAEFYARAAGNPRIAPYFAGVDIDELQRHFLAAVMLVTGEGVRVGTVRSMENRHAKVRNPSGEPITFEVYDMTVGIFADVLSEELRRDHIDPGPVIYQLIATIAPLRDAIATA